MDFEYIAEAGKECLSVKSNDNRNIDDVTLGMLENNNIEGLLPVNIIRNNYEIECRYDLMGLYSFNEVVNDRVAKERLATLLNAILDVCNVCGDYMIDCSQIVIDPEYIYTDECGSKYRFIVAPFSELDNEFFEKLKAFILELSYCYNDDCTYLERLKVQLRHCKFLSVDVLKNVLVEGGLYRKEEVIQRSLQEKQLKSKLVEHNKIPMQLIDDGANEEDEVDFYDDDMDDVPNKRLFRFRRKAKAQSMPSKKGANKTTHFGGFAIPGEADGGYSKGSVEIPENDVNIKSSKINIDLYRTEKVNIDNTQFEPRSINQRSHNPNCRKYSLLRTSTGELFELDKDVIKIGRKKSLVDICINGDLYVSRLHATLHNENGKLFIINNRADNGTYVNGRMVTTQTELHNGDKISIGDEEFEVK